MGKGEKLKMKFAVVFFLLLDIPHSKGQQKPDVFGHIVLRLSYPSFYNGYEKYCCKLYPRGCYKLVDNRGFVCDLLKGRVTNAQSDGWIEFKIWNAQLVDTGYYRCIVVGTQNHLYKDYYIEISEPSRRHSLPPIPLTTTPTPLTTTIKSYKTSNTLPDATMASLAKDISDNSKVPWSFGLPLTVVVSIAVLMIISSVTAAVCYRVKAKNECEETLCESSQHRASEVSGIVYTTVDFTPHQVPTGLYANLSVPSPRARAPDRDKEDHDGMVEYTTLAIRQ